MILQADRYAKDKGRVFYKARTIAGADPASFVLLKERDYAKDKRHVYITTLPVRGADPATFVVVEPPYGRDAKRMYNGTVAMDVADIAHFEPVPGESVPGTWMTSYDKNGFLFNYGEAFADLEITQQNPVMVGGPWARDGKFYYFGPARVEGADYASFKVLSSFEARDAKRKYMWSFPEAELAERRKRYQYQ